MGDARRKRLEREARLDALATGTAVPRPETCPACGSRRIGYATPGPTSHAAVAGTEFAVCADCRAIWEPFPALYVEDAVCAEPCDNCAFRPGSPEQADPVKWKALVETLKPDQSLGHFTGRFFCHKNVPIDQKVGPGNFLFPKRALDLGSFAVDIGEQETYDTSKMRSCSGWLRMVWAQNAKRSGKK